MSYTNLVCANTPSYTDLDCLVFYMKYLRHKQVILNFDNKITAYTPVRDLTAFGLVTILGTNGRSELSILSLNWACGRRMLRAVKSLYLLVEGPETGVTCIQMTTHIITSKTTHDTLVAFTDQLHRTADVKATSPSFSSSSLRTNLMYLIHAGTGWTGTPDTGWTYRHHYY